MGIAKQIPYKSVSEARAVSIDYTDLLDSGEVLAGTPTVVEVGSSDLTLSNKARNSSGAVTILGDSVAVNSAVQFHVASGGVAGKRYTIKVTVSTNASTAQTFVDLVRLDVRSDES